MIMQARLKAGWVTEAELAPPPAPEAEAAPADAAAAASVREHETGDAGDRRTTSELDRGATRVAPGMRAALRAHAARSSRSTR